MQQENPMVHPAENFGNNNFGYQIKSVTNTNKNM